MEIIDQFIQVLQRVKNCDKVLDNLKRCRENMLFKDGPLDDEKSKWARYVHSLIEEAIELIEKTD